MAHNVKNKLKYHLNVTIWVIYSYIYAYLPIYTYIPYSYQVAVFVRSHAHDTCFAREVLTTTMWEYNTKQHGAPF